MQPGQLTVARFGDGLVQRDDLVEAAEAATTEALRPLSGEAPDLLAVFVSPGAGNTAEQVSEAATRAAVRSGARHVVGCTAGGVIGGGRGVEAAPAVSVWASVLPDVRLRTFHLETYRSDNALTVLGMPDPLADEEVAVLCVDPYSFPVDGFVERSNDLMPDLTLVGGLASGSAGDERPSLFLDGDTFASGAVGVVLGNLDQAGVGVAPLVSQGCRPFGPPMVVTRAEGNVLHELAGVPALAKLEEVVADLVPEEQTLVARGLQIGVAMDEYADEHELGDFLVRGVLGADPDTGGLVIGDVVEVGRTVRFQVRDAGAAEHDLTLSLQRFHERANLRPVSGALLFSCNGRGAGLFPSADHDVRAVSSGLGTGGVGGFFAAGEIGPVGGRNHLHGFTASVLAFGTPANG